MMLFPRLGYLVVCRPIIDTKVYEPYGQNKEQSSINTNRNLALVQLNSSKMIKPTQVSNPMSPTGICGIKQYNSFFGAEFMQDF